MKIIDLTGRKFGRLTVTSLNPKRNKYKKLLWNCKCDCGNTIVAIGSLLKRGNIKSCGCLYKETRPFVAQKHKGSKTRLYCLWNGIKARCFNKNHKEYKFYGGKGIKICEEWLDFDTFRKWAYNNGYEECLTIERKDINKDYCPENCTWITKSEQTWNKSTTVRVFYKNRYLTIKEKLQSIISVTDKSKEWQYMEE